MSPRRNAMDWRGGKSSKQVKMDLNSAGLEVGRMGTYKGEMSAIECPTQGLRFENTAIPRWPRAEGYNTRLQNRGLLWRH